VTQKGNFGYPDKAILVWKVKKSDKRQFYCKALLEAISQYMRTLIPEIKITPCQGLPGLFLLYYISY
jgi:hypothetical protein